jgi:rSAM/selenodomain-associated transferase 2
VRQALALLTSGTDVVVGPAADGGYWLLGVHARLAGRLPALFQDNDWGSGRVFEQTMSAAAGIHASVELLPVLADVDHAEDLPLLEEAREHERRASEPGSVTVVIPTLNEAGTIADAVTAAFESGANEVIVSDGGSSDATPTIAANAGARVVTAPAGRAVQMNAGAREARGDALLFVHADCLLPSGAAAEALQALRSGAVAGAFSFGTDSPRWADRFAAAAGRLRHRITGYAYGDQGLFLPARTFDDLGGFPNLPVMEDWEIMRRLQRIGSVRILPLILPSSARGWQQHGLVRSALVNATVIAGYRLGVQPSRLASLRGTITSGAKRR